MPTQYSDQLFIFLYQIVSTPFLLFADTPSPQTSQGQNESFEDIQQPIDLNQVSVLTQADWNRIQGHLTRNVREKELIETKRAEKLALHQHSKDMVKNWSNTIAVSFIISRSFILCR